MRFHEFLFFLCLMFCCGGTAYGTSGDHSGDHSGEGSGNGAPGQAELKKL